jgi:hypothetical protein
MTRHQYTKNIYRELRELNERIDYKILRGQRYSDESRRHKALLRQIARQSNRGFLSKLFSIA